MLLASSDGRNTTVDLSGMVKSPRGIAMEKVVWTNCGESIDRAQRLKVFLDFCKAFRDHGRCGRKYYVMLLTAGSFILFFPEKHKEMVR